MKKLITLVVVFCFATLGLMAQNPQVASKDSIIFAKLVHDYGTIVQGADGGSEFVFTNKGQKPLLLADVRASCGCTAPVWSREPILPGQQGVIKVGYNTQLLGGFSKVISVTSNADNNIVTLTIRGNVTEKN